MSHRRAFSLIELMVVIGIIAVLVGILIPVLSLARESSKSANCLSNLRQIGAAALSYSTANGECTLPGYASNVAVSNNGQDADSENYATILVNGGYLTTPHLLKVNDSVRTNNNVFRCPSGTDDFLYIDFTEASGNSWIYPANRKDGMGARPLRTMSKSSGLIVDTWYGINSCLDGSAAGGTPCKRIPTAGTSDWSLPHLGQIKSPSKMVFLYDGIFYNLEFAGDRINARHNFSRNSNILFFDNHAETFPTDSLPGGFGPNPTGVDLFSTASLKTNSPRQDWRLDQK